MEARGKGRGGKRELGGKGQRVSRLDSGMLGWARVEQGMVWIGMIMIQSSMH